MRVKGTDLNLQEEVKSSSFLLQAKHLPTSENIFPCIL